MKKSTMFLLWVGAAISISEIYTGGLLAPLGFGKALTAIIIGHLIGTGFLALGGYISFIRRCSAMDSAAFSLGRNGGSLVALCNVVQLTGWTLVMVVQAGSAITAILPHLPFAPVSLALGLLVLLWALIFGSPAQWINSAVVILLVALCAVLFWESAGGAGAPAVFSERLSFALALELSIAMPVSWLPLAGDYSYRAKDPLCAWLMPFAGYFLGSVFMYGFGLFIAVKTGGDFFTLIGASRFRLIACAVVVFSTLTTAFMDLYSAAVSSRQIVNIKNPRFPILILGLSAAILSAVFPAEKYSGFLTNFLTAIGMVFVPVYGVIFIDFFMKRSEDKSPRRMTLPALKLPAQTGSADLRSEGWTRLRMTLPALKGGVWTRLRINLPGLAAALAGMAVYALCTRYEWGIPTLLSLAAAAIVYIPVVLPRKSGGSAA